MIYVFWILSLFLLYVFIEHKKRDRINEILNLVDNLYKKDYKIPMKQDDFSILEDTIYKLFLEIIEEKEKFKKYSKTQLKNVEDISHQIKTPIMTMLLDIETLERENYENREIQKLKFQLNRLNSLVGILLKLSSLDAQLDKMKREKFYVEEVFEYALDILETEIDKKEIEIIKDCSDEYIYGDFYWINEAIINILKNAVDLESCTKIIISVKDNPIFTLINICDNGGGIDKKYKDKIFQRFYKTPDSKGFGIGLAMAKVIIESNNGEISVENIQDGANFKIKIYK
ncbi:sensor histidine kinase [Peptoniphilus indolicus]|uniref:histidine kinase n=1 Tax=Peptoniphilus indolicus TaxID=33030 RepID=A0A379DBS6_9FIRM|nr:HAMP domain-containing sensor histidine kinase [Peptoniphilus indolicus]SUB75032.1 Sensor protein CpxA [Peptoniphilus indolicus]